MHRNLDSVVIRVACYDLGTMPAFILSEANDYHLTLGVHCQIVVDVDP